MQKIILESKTVPTDVQSFLVCSSTNLTLNRDENLSVSSGLKHDGLNIINPEGTQPEYTQGLKANKVYVLSINGKPLMPCLPCKAKRLLKNKKAVVVKRFPFTIKLNFECENKVQIITLGIDSGYGNIGFSVTSETEELISGTIKLDGKTSSRLKEMN